MLEDSYSEGTCSNQQVLSNLQTLDIAMQFRGDSLGIYWGFLISVCVEAFDPALVFAFQMCSRNMHM